MRVHVGLTNLRHLAVWWRRDISHNSSFSSFFLLPNYMINIIGICPNENRGGGSEIEDRGRRREEEEEGGGGAYTRCESES